MSNPARTFAAAAGFSPQAGLVELDAARSQRAADVAADTRQNRLQDAHIAVWATEPPDDLKVDVRGLPPARAALLRFEAWQVALHDKLAKIQAGRAAFLETLGVAARTQDRIAELISSGV